MPDSRRKTRNEHSSGGAVIELRDGAPFVIRRVGTTTDFARVGQDASYGCNGSIGNFWVKNGNPTNLGQFAAGGTNDPTLYFATKNADGTPIFTAPAINTFNQQSVRDIITMPGFYNWNTGLFKRFTVNEHFALQFRAEAFNVTNHPNWNNPGLNPSALSTFGKVTGKSNDVRNLQLSLRASF